VDELYHAEVLAKLFLAWEIDPEMEDVTAKLRDMLEQADRIARGDDDGDVDGAKEEGQHEGASLMVLDEAELVGEYDQGQMGPIGDILAPAPV
jgi:hypothetical protein